jgi:hypothetical protein
MAPFTVTCKSCGTANRVPAEREGVSGRCGNCQAALPPVYWQPQQLTDESFDDFVARYDGPVVAEFWASW